MHLSQSYIAHRTSLVHINSFKSLCEDVLSIHSTVCLIHCLLKQWRFRIILNSHSHVDVNLLVRMDQNIFFFNVSKLVKLFRDKVVLRKSPKPVLQTPLGFFYQWAVLVELESDTWWSWSRSCSTIFYNCSYFNKSEACHIEWGVRLEYWQLKGLVSQWDVSA